MIDIFFHKNFTAGSSSDKAAAAREGAENGVTIRVEF